MRTWLTCSAAVPGAQDGDRRRLRVVRAARSPCCLMRGEDGLTERTGLDAALRRTWWPPHLGLSADGPGWCADRPRPDPAQELVAAGRAGTTRRRHVRRADR